MKTILTLFTAILVIIVASSVVMAQSEKPNILVIWGDDIGWQNVSAYGMGTMG